LKKESAIAYYRDRIKSISRFMETVNINQATTDLSLLLSRVALGEEIIIANQGIPIAKLVPFRTSSNRRDSLGQDRGKFTVPEDFND
jgi:antitoxin (DNA-binding transcriptional repressor) of toxin-antitoxin stability system